MKREDTRRVWFRRGVIGIAAALVSNPTSKALAAQHYQKGPVKFATAFSTGSAFSTVSRAMVDAVKLAIDDAGSDPTRPSFSVTELPDDSPDKFAAAASDGDVQVLFVGPDSQAIASGIASAAASGLMSIAPVVVGAPVSKGLDQASLKHFTTMAPTADIQCNLAGQFAAGQGYSSIYFVDSAVTSSLGLRQAFGKAATDLDLSIGGSSTLDAAGANIDKLVSEIISAGVDAVYFALPYDTQAVKVITALRVAGVEAACILTQDYLVPSLISELQSYTDEVYIIGWSPFTTVSDDENTSVPFDEKYQIKYGTVPGPQALYAYAAATAAIDAVVRAQGGGRPAVRDALLTGAGIETLLGTLTFKDQGMSAVKTASVFQIDSLNDEGPIFREVDVVSI